MDLKDQGTAEIGETKMLETHPDSTTLKKCRDKIENLVEEGENNNKI